MHRSLHIDNVRNISQSIPGESDGFHANPKYCAVPLSGSAGVIAIIQVNFLSFFLSEIVLVNTATSCFIVLVYNADKK